MIHTVVVQVVAVSVEKKTKNNEGAGICVGRKAFKS